MPVVHHAIRLGFVTLALLALTLFTLPAKAATNLRVDSYDLFFGDVNDDGYSDFYLRAKRKILILAAEVAIPIAYSDGNSVVISGYDGAVLPWPQEVDIGTLTAASFEFHFGDFNGDGVLDMLAQSRTNVYDSFILQGDTSGTPKHAQVFDTLLGHEVRFATLTVRDINQDGRHDIIIETTSGLKTHAIASATGDFEPESLVNRGKRVAGATAGAVEIGASGDAGYAIPITVPAGGAGMQPTLSLSYSSSAPNGYLGVGWDINGLSEIFRCEKQQYLDGKVEGITWTNSDPFCLDGARLIPIEGINGANGTEYRTEIESFARIRSFGGSATTGPERFMVEYKSGEIAHYGRSWDSRVEAQGRTAVVSWALTSVEDRYGNKRNYYYFEDTSSGEHRIDRIQYPGGEVHFEYGSRSDVVTGYSAGSRITVSSRLSRVRALVAGQLYREYNLHYETSPVSGFLRLTSVLECGADGSCLNPTHFSWYGSTAPSTYSLGTLNATDICANGSTNYGVCNDNDNHTTLMYGDVNGDGITDVCWRSDTGIRCKLSTDSGITGAEIVTSHCKNGTHCGHSDRFKTMQLIDVNLDGKADLVYNNSGTIVIHFSTGTGLGNGVGTNVCGGGTCIKDNVVRYGDITGDGIADACFRTSSGVRCAMGTGSGFSASGLIHTNICGDSSSDYGQCNDKDNYATINLLDINGNGKSNLVFRSDYRGVVVFDFNGSNFQEITSYRAGNICRNGYSQCNDGDNHYSIQYADTNGDGLSDLCYRSDVGIRCHLNTGANFSGPVITTSACANGDSTCNDGDNRDTIQFTDIDGDGKDDLFYRSDAGLRFLRSTGSSFAPILSSPICYNGSTSHGVCNDGDNHMTIRIMDVTGDGISEIVYRSDSGIRVMKINADAHVDVLASATNGFGLRTDIYYQPLTNTNTYIQADLGTQVSYPTVTIAGPVPVVSKVISHLANGEYKVVDYTYWNLRSRLDGRGSMGFEQIQRTARQTTNIDSELMTDKISREVDRFAHGADHPNPGSLIRTSLSLGGIIIQAKVAETEHSYASATLDVSPKVRFPYIVSTTEMTWEPGGILTKKLQSQQTTLYQYDLLADGKYARNSAGNVTSTRVTVSDEAGNHYSTETSNRYEQENYAQWILGRLTHATTTSSGTGRDTRVRESAWRYLANGYLQSETIEPSDPALAQTTSYTYDSRGLKQTVTVSANGVLPRSTTFTYDAEGRFVTQTRNDLGHTATTQYDPVLGLPTAVTGANGLTSYSSYDGFGRVVTQIAPDGTSTTTRFAFKAAGDPAQTAYTVTTTTNTGGWARSYYDKFGQVFQKRHRDGLGAIIVQETTFDAAGDVVTQSEPYKLGATTVYRSEIISRDSLRRPLSTKNPAGHMSSINYQGLTTVYTNEKSQTRTEVRSADGLLKESIDHQGNKVSYAYDSLGNMIRMTDEAANFSTHIIYDNRGNKVSMTDPNMGSWHYTYNAFGELVAQQDANGVVTCMAYDSLGRMVRRVDNYQGALPQDARNDCANDDTNPQTSFWVYDGASNAVGKLVEVRGPGGYRETYSYDSLGRVTAVAKVIDNETFVTQTSYDDRSRPTRVVHPGGLAVTNHYNSYGTLVEVRKDASTDYYWKLLELDERGQVKAERLASGAIATDRSFHPTTGLPESIVSSSLGRPVGDLQFNYTEFDELGNLTYRKDANLNNEETILYDDLNRLLHIDEKLSGSSVTRRSLSYNANGNILSKWDVGAYDYGGTCGGVKAGPNAVTRAGNDTYCYDRNGNMLSGGGRSVEWTSYGLPKRFSRGLTRVDFVYGPDRSRIQRIDDQGGEITRTTYVGAYERVIKPGGAREDRYYVAGAVVTVENGNLAAPKERYMLRDHLGSVVAYVNAAKLGGDYANAVERSSFDAWGKRRKQDWQAFTLEQLYSYKSSVSDRGFTGHEQIDAVGLIHMNGRVYDPQLGRFISADPIVQDPTDLQSLNRYTYVRNNPVTLVDPSGFSWASKRWKSFRKAFEKYAGFNLNAYIWKKSAKEFGRFARKNKYVAEIAQIGGCIATATVSGPGGCAAVTAYVTYGVTDGDMSASLRAGAIAYIQADIAAAIGGTFGDSALTSWQGAASVAAHATLGGAVSVAQGGKFAHGAIAAGFGKAFALGATQSGLYGALHAAGDGIGGIAARTTMAALVGGTASKLSGGNFANGARTAAMQHLFNAEGRWLARLARKLWTITPHGTKAALQTRSGRKYYQSKADDTWWSKDTAGHGGSAWKVFEQRSDGLHWMADADEYGNYIVNKHKGDVGMFIPNKQLSSANIPNQAITNSLIIGVTVLEAIDPLTYLYSGNRPLPPPSER